MQAARSFALATCIFSGVKMQDTTLEERLIACVKIIGNGDKTAEKTGIPRSTLETYLTGKATPKADRLAAICYAANVNGHWLLTGNGEPEIHKADGRAQQSINTDAFSRSIAEMERVTAGRMASAEQRVALVLLAYRAIELGESGGELLTFMDNAASLLPRATRTQVWVAEDELAILKMYQESSEARRKIFRNFASAKEVTTPSTGNAIENAH